MAQEAVYIHVLALAIEPPWRARPLEDRFADLAGFATAAQLSGAGVRTLSYTSVGLEPSVDILLWRTGPALDALESAAATVLASRLGPWLRVRHAFLGRTAPSQYVTAPSEQESGLTREGSGRYLVVYPFTKSADWYLLSREARQGIMNEHMRVGRGYPSVRQALAYSFGLDDQDFIVAYETDDLVAFGELVRELRATESRRSTVRDTPLLVGVRRSLDELPGLLGAAR
ncbi:chlorite dismutase family protein [soil metagenome]